MLDIMKIAEVKNEIKQRKYVSDYPILMKEWNYETNSELGLNPEKITYGSHKKAWWKCEKGHEWQTTIKTRTLENHKCPYCANQKVLIGYNDFESWAKQNKNNLLKEWNYEKNTVSPLEIVAFSNKKVWWKCKKEHEWEANVCSRIYGNNCPYCSNELILEGYNDLKTWCINNNKEYLLNEWNYSKNDVLPTNVGKSSNKKAWWKCEKGHEWQASIGSRTANHNCPICNNSGMSVPEKTVAYYLNKHFDIIENYRPEWLHNKEIDIFIPKLNVGIEYDGVHFHKNIKKDILKNRICLCNGVYLIHIREKGSPAMQGNVYWTKSEDKNDLENIIINLMSDLGIAEKLINVDIKRDQLNILKNIKQKELEKSLFTWCKNNNHNNLLEEWNYEKNNNLSPTQFSFSSHEKVWWKCKHGHEWNAEIKSRIHGNGCPYCSGRYLTEGISDFKTWCKNNNHKNLLEEWDYEKNNALSLYPNRIMKNSKEKAWWKCSSCNYEWQSAVMNRTRGNNCPKCAIANRKNKIA